MLIQKKPIGENANKLSDEKSASLEGEISYTEIANALKNMKNNKSPGLDGFTVEFFKFFWVDIGTFILRSINYGYRNGSLSITQKQGLITCLPKPNKSRLSLKNWRPISLLNVVYKLASSVIANRVKQTLQSNKVAKIRNRYNQVPHLTRDTNGKVTNSQKTPQTRAKRSALSQQVTTKHI